MHEATRLCAVSPSPESELRRLFREEDELLVKLGKVRDAQREARRDYAKSLGLLLLPSMMKLREVLR